MAISYIYQGWITKDQTVYDYGLGTGDPAPQQPNDKPVLVNTTTGFPSAINDGMMTEFATTLTLHGLQWAGGGGISGNYDDDLGWGGTFGGTLYRIREGVERYFITDINRPAGSARGQSSVAIMYDLASSTAGEFNHVPGGSNVLFMDGSVRFVRYPSDFPVSRAWAHTVALF